MFHIHCAVPNEVTAVFLAYLSEHPEESLVLADFFVDEEGKAFVHNISMPNGKDEDPLVVRMYLDKEAQDALSDILDEEKAKVLAWGQSFMEASV